MRRFPDFYCIGVQKSGTTWLYENLVKHPDIYMPFMKEIQYFNHLYIPGHRKWTIRHRLIRVRNAIIHNLEKGENVDFDLIRYLASCGKNTLDDEWYSNFFNYAKVHQLCGEMTPEYSILPIKGIRHMLRLNSKSRFIISFRNPIKRDFSHAKMIFQNNGFAEKIKIDDELTEEGVLLSILERPGVYQRSEYKPIIETWEAEVGRDNILILFNDNIAEKPGSVLSNVCGFLGLGYRDTYFPEKDNIVHKGPNKEMTFKIHEVLRRRHRDTIDYMKKRFGNCCLDWD